MGKADKKKMSEKQTYAQILALAKEQGVEEKVQKIIIKYEDAVKGARSEAERKHIAHCGLAEIHRTIGCVGPLIVDGVEILPATPGYEEQIASHMGLIKLD
jgi:hypothetical protein